MDLRSSAGWRLSTAEKLSMTERVPALSILASTTKRVVRSTKVPTEERLPSPLIRSPSQWPGIRRSSISGGRVDALHVLDLTAPVHAPAARFAHLVVMAQAGDQLALELAARMQIDRGIDGLMRDRFVRVVGPHDAQYVRNLLRRPELLEKMPDHHEQCAVTMQLGCAARCDAAGTTLQMGLVGIVGVGARRTINFPADRAGSTAKAFSNAADTALVVEHGHHDGSLLGGQVGVISRHGSTLQ